MPKMTSQTIATILNTIKDMKDTKKSIFADPNYEIYVTYQGGSMTIEDALEKYSSESYKTIIEDHDFQLLMGHKNAIKNGKPIDSLGLCCDNKRGLIFESNENGQAPQTSTEYQPYNISELIKEAFKALKVMADETNQQPKRETDDETNKPPKKFKP